VGELIEYREVFIGSLCNNNCIYCSHPHKEGRNLQDVRNDLQKKDSQDSLLLYGGEPTVREDLMEIIKFAKDLGYERIKIRTNGRILSNWNALQMLIKEGCYLYEIKVWGPNPQIFDSLTRVQNSFYQTFQGLQNLISITPSGVSKFSPFVCSIVPLVRENYAYAEAIARSLFPFRIDRLIFSLRDFSLPLKDALYYVQNAIEACTFSKVWSLTEGIPPCFMEGFEHHISEFLENKSEGYVKARNCQKCVYDEVCPGVKKEYYNSFNESGVEPVRESRYLEDLKALKSE
jgi:MoaA/NifB/PqqE/SkfB family radical SAM enzyme